MYKLWIAAALAALALLEVWKHGPRAWRRPRQDWMVELTSTALVPGAVIPLVTYASASALAHLAPQRAGALAGLPWAPAPSATAPRRGGVATWRGNKRDNFVHSNAL